MERSCARKSAAGGTIRSRALNATALGLVLYCTSIAAFAPRAIAGSNVIVPDGRTSTKLTTYGSVTSITTNTIADGSAFNSFSQFQVGSGNTVNLQIPSAAARLLNIVTDGPVNVQGVLNSYKDGKLGGNVFFADPYGFVVGPSGAVNVGSLTVTTPTAQALAAAMDASGTINAAAMNNVIIDATPISADGSILVQGRINAKTDVHLHGQTVQVAASNSVQSSASGTTTRSQALFQASVNTAGLQQGGAIKVTNGTVEIVADGDATVAGTVSADGSAGQNAGRVSVSSGNNIAIAGTATISAAGHGANSSGGVVSIKAGKNLNVASGAAVNVSGGSSGNGGTIELSAADTASFSQITLNAGATSGTPGSIVIDPDNVVIGPNTDPNATQGSIVSVGGASVTLTATDTITFDNAGYISSGGGAVTLTTGNSSTAGTITMNAGSYIDSNGGSVTFNTNNGTITLNSGSYINTRQTVALGGTPASMDDITTAPMGNSGAVTLNASTITVAGTIEAEALNPANPAHTYSDGDITLNAQASDSENIGKSSATTDVDISGTIKGGNIDVEAASSAETDMGILAQTTQDLLSTLFGAGGAYVDGQAYSTITVDQGAVIKGSGNVTLNSYNTSEAEDPVYALPAAQFSILPGLATEVVVGNVTAESSATVATGATIDAGGILTVRSHNTATLDDSMLTITGSTAIGISVAYSTATVTSNASVAQGATINASQVNVVALNDNSFSTSATDVLLGTGQAGLVIAIANDMTSTANAHFGSSYTAPATLLGGGNGGLLVEAQSNTSNDAVIASSTVGADEVLRAITSPFANALAGVNTVLDSSDDILSALDAIAPVKLGAAMALTLGETQSSTATLGNDQTNGGTQSPFTTVGGATINASQVAVVANTTDAGVRSAGESAVNSPNNEDPANPSAAYSVSAGIAVAERDISATAEVEPDTSITASQIGVQANTNLPISITWLDGDSFSEVMSHINGNLGVADDVTTSFSDSTADAGETGISGSIDIFNVSASATAFVGDGATLKQTSAVAGPWTATLDTGDDSTAGLSGGTAQTAAFADSIAVEATRDVAAINFGGSVSIFLQGLGGEGSTDATSIGATYDQSTYSGSTIAGIGADVTVKTTGDLDVEAMADDKAINVAPAAGHGGGLALEGMEALFKLDTDVHATIDPSDEISASNLTLTANQAEDIFTVAGGLFFGNADSVGAMATQNIIDTDVEANIKANAADDPFTPLLSNAILNYPTLAGITLTEGTLDITASESGGVQSLAVEIDSGSNAAIGAASPVSTISDNIAATIDGATVSANDVYLNATANDEIETAAVGVASGGTGIAAAGSIAVATISPTITATITDGASVMAVDNVGVVAGNEDTIATYAGQLGLGSSALGVGLSIVTDVISSSTTASITGSTTSVNANGTDAADTFSVNSGILSNPPDVSSINAPTIVPPSLSETQSTVHGLAVDATSNQETLSDAVTLGFSSGGSSASVNLVTTVIGASANAYIQGASIDTQLTSDPTKPLVPDPNNPNVSYPFVAPELDVFAGNNTLEDDFVAALAASSNFSGAGAVTATKFTGTTKAYTLDATIGTTTGGEAVLGSLDVSAQSTQDEADIVLGGAAGPSSVGAAGSMPITLFAADTEAYVTGGSAVVSDLSVDANSDNGANILAGAGAIGSAGVGGSIAVTINNDTTLGYVGDLPDTLNNSAVIDQTSLTIGSATVDATTTNDFTNLVIAGAAGYYAGIAAMADVTTMSNTTDAGFYNAAVNQNGGVAAAGNISVNATDSDSISSTAGGGAAGAAGIGIAVNVIVMHASTTGTLLDSAITSNGTVSVSAEGERDITAETVTGAVGYFAGVSAAAGVILAGTDASSDVQGQIDGTVTTSDGIASGQGITGLANTVDGGSPDAVTASVAGGSLTAGTLTVQATGLASSSNESYGFAAGAYAGVGGAIAYTDMGNTVVATIDGTSPTASNITVTAQMGDGPSGSAVSTDAYAGGGGTVGIGAGISIAQMDDTVGASLSGGATSNDAGTFQLSASDDASVSSTAAGGAAGDIAVGVMVATASKNSNVSANTLVGASITDFANVTLDATDAGSVSSSATGVGGGETAAANAAAATADDDATVRATLANQTSITGMTGTTTVEASDTPDLDASAYGVTVAGGVALGISASIANVAPTVDATLGDSVSIAGAGALSISATLAPSSGQTDASSNAFAGAGGALVGLDGAIATTGNNSDVEATTGATDVLPDGDVSIAADNTSNQSAMASGVGVGGIAGGASYAQANSGSMTIATLGAGATDPTHTGSLSVVASGTDNDSSHAVAGTYGLIAGNASVSETDNDATVEANVGAGTMLPASTISIKASHQDNYSEDADSSEISVLGESGADAKHSADVTVETSLGNGTILIASGTIDIGAENDFTNVGTSDSADAGGGGVANGASGAASTGITGQATVDIGNSVALTSGTDPILNPGYINIVADSNVTAVDTVSLSTGGALEGSGVREDFSATTNNFVCIGASDMFLSFGNFDAGTYTDDNVTAQALAHTWGILGAVAAATSNVTLSSEQKVTLGQNSLVEVYGNANITAGQNPATAQGSIMNGSAIAESWVSGFVAVPAANASSSATDNTTTTISQGAIVNAGQNATIGSYAGALSPTDEAEGQGYELGFIPVKDGNASTPSSTETQDVVINGAATAGAFNNLVITIPDCGDTAGGYCTGQITVSGNVLSDATMISPLFSTSTDFNAIDFINDRVQGADAALLVSSVSTGTVGAVTLGTLFASPGVVTVNADSLTGTGSLTANGGANITVNNASPDYLIINAAEIPNIPGGSVYFTGKAASAPVGMTDTQNNSDLSTNITFNDSYTGNVSPPVIFVNGEINNLGGLVKITDQLGSLGQFEPIEAQNVILDVPQGTLVVDLATGLLETTGASVEADWEPFIVLPGNEAASGSTTQGPFNADLAFAYAVNAVFNPTGQYTTDAALTAALDNGGTLSGVLGVNYDSNFTDGKGSDGQAFLAYGTCYPGNHSGLNCGASGNGAALNQGYSPVNAIWNSDWSDLSRELSLVPVETLTYSSTTNIAAPPASSTTTSSVSAIVANTISINASYIDVDSDVTAGPPTNWSVNLPASLASQISADQAAYQNGTHGATFMLTGDTTVGADDSLIGVSYVAGATAADGEIVVNNVLAAAQEAASIVLDGAIMSTNSLGHIHVNAGLGQVTIDNETGTPVELNNVEAGSASRLGGISGAIEIIDTERPAGNPSDPDHFWYEFTPGVGTTTYVSDDPTLSTTPFVPNANAVNQGTSTATDFTFDPVAGLRWEWQEMAFMQRTVTLSTNGDGDPTTTNWFFTNPNGTPLGLNDNNPYYYIDTVDQASAATAGSGLYAYTPGAIALNPYTGALGTPGSLVLTQDPSRAGTLVTGQSDSLPYMQETITGTVTPTVIQAVDSDCVYGPPHCGSQAEGPYDTFHGVHAGISSLGGLKFLEDNGDFDFDYLTQGTVTVTTSVKADNPIAVSFTGAISGTVTINSDAPVTVNGQIENPNGTTTITTTAGNVTTAPDGSVVTQYLNLNTAGSVGTVSNPLTTTQTNSGTLNASGATGVYVAATSALNIGQIESSGGDVVLSAAGDIMRAGTPSPANIVANNVTLTATNDGNIGTSAAPIQTAATGTVNITADGNIAIEQTQGNLNVGTIQSVGIGGTLGAVQVAVDNGALLDAANTTQTGALSQTQQEAIWAKLKLTIADGGGINAGASAPTVAAISSAVDSDYQQYWMLLSQGTVQNGSFVLNPGSVSLFQQVATAAGVTPQAYTAQLYATVVADFAQYVGTNWQSQSAFQSQVQNFNFTPSQSEIAGLTANATESEGQLLSALSLTALQPSSNTTVGTTTPNIIGGVVTLSASDGIGSLAPPVPIDLADLTSGNLSGLQEGAIALAKNPGAILFTGVNAQGQTVQFSGTTVPIGVTVTGVSIGQTAPLFVSATGTFTASAPEGGVFAQATAGDLDLGSVNAQTGEVNLTAPGSILAASAGNNPVITGGNITLLAGDSIGSAGTPIIYTGPSGTVLSSASAGEDIYLEASGIDMLVGRISADGDAVLSTPQGSIEPTLAGVALDADNLTLTVANNIGSSAQAFEVQLTAGGQLNATAGGSANVTGVGDLDVGTFTAVGDLEVTAFGNLTANDLVSSTGSVAAGAGLNDTLTTVTAATTATLTAVGALALDDVTTGSDMTLGSGGALAVDAGGALTSGGALTVTQASSLTMDAGSTMAAADALSLTTSGNATLTAMTSGGDTTIDAGGDTTIGSLTSGGAITVDAGGALTAGTLQSASNMSLTSGGDLDATTLNAIAGNATLTAGANADIQSLAAGQVTISSIGSLELTNVQASGKLTADAGGALTAGTLQSASDMSLMSGGDLNATTLNATAGNVTLTAGGDATIASLTSGGTLTVDAGGALTAGMVQSASDMSLMSGGDLDATTLNSTSGNATLTAGADADVQSITADQVAITTTGSLELTNLSASGDVSLSSGGAMTLEPNGSITGQDTIDISAASFTMGANTTMTAAGDLTLDTTGNAVLTDVNVGGATSIVTGGSLSIDPLTSTGPIDINSGGPITLAADGSITTSSTLTAIGASLAMGADSLLEGAGVALTLSGPAILSEVESTLNGSNALTITATSIAGNGDGQPNIVATGPNATTTLTAQNGIGTPSNPLVIDTPQVTLSTQSGDIALEALSSMTFSDIAAPSDLDITGDGNLTFGDVSSGGTVLLSAAGNLTFDSIGATGNVTLDADGGLSGGSVRGANLVINAGSIALAEVTGQNLSFSAQSTLDIENLVVSQSVDLSAPYILADLTQPASTAPLRIGVSGPGNSEATDVDLHIDAPAGILFTTFFAQNSTITTTAADVDIADGDVSGQMFLFTPYTKLYLNDQTPTPIRGVSEQFFAPSDLFFLDQVEGATFTNAFAVDFGPGISAMHFAPNGKSYDGFTLVHTAPLPLFTPSYGKTLGNEGLANGWDEILEDDWGGNTHGAPNLSVFDLWVLATGGQPAVNVGGGQQ